MTDVVSWDDPRDPRLPAVREAVYAAFDDFDDVCWDHALGGRHFAIFEGARVIAHASVVPRTITVGDRAMRAGYVEAVSTARDRRGQGLATAVMKAVDAYVRDRYELGVLATGTHGFYERLGWRRWRGPSWCLEPGGPRRTADEDDNIMVLPQDALDLGASIACPWRPGDAW